MKAPTTKIRVEEAQKLLDYGFANFSFKEFGKKGEEVGTLQVNKGVTQQISAILEEDAGTLVEKNKEKNITQNLTLEEKIDAPVKKGQKLGEITFTLEGKTLSTINIIAQEDVEKINLFNMTKQICYSWINLLRE